MFKDQNDNLKVKKQNQQGSYSKESSLKENGGNQYLIQNSLICNLGTTLGTRFCSGFSVRDYYGVTGDGYLVPQGKAVMGDRETGDFPLSQLSPSAPVSSSRYLPSLRAWGNPG